MTEQEYIWTAALTNIRLATEALRYVDIGTDREIPEGEHRTVLATLARWRMALEEQVQRATMGEDLSV